MVSSRGRESATINEDPAYHRRISCLPVNYSMGNSKNNKNKDKQTKQKCKKPKPNQKSIGVKKGGWGWWGLDGWGAEGRWRCWYVQILCLGKHTVQKSIFHYGDVVIGTLASQITSLTIVYSTVYSGADRSKDQSSASLAFVWGPMNSPHKWPVTRKMFPF